MRRPTPDHRKERPERREIISYIDVIITSLWFLFCFTVACNNPAEREQESGFWWCLSVNALRGLTLALRLMACIALNKVNLLCLSLSEPLNQKHNGYTKKWFSGRGGWWGEGQRNALGYVVLLRLHYNVILVCPCFGHEDGSAHQNTRFTRQAAPHGEPGLWSQWVWDESVTRLSNLLIFRTKTHHEAMQKSEVCGEADALHVAAARAVRTLRAWWSLIKNAARFENNHTETGKANIDRFQHFPLTGY